MCDPVTIGLIGSAVVGLAGTAAATALAPKPASAAPATAASANDPDAKAAQAANANFAAQQAKQSASSLLATGSPSGTTNSPTTSSVLAQAKTALGA